MSGIGILNSDGIRTELVISERFRNFSESELFRNSEQIRNGISPKLYHFGTNSEQNFLETSGNGLKRKIKRCCKRKNSAIRNIFGQYFRNSEVPNCSFAAPFRSEFRNGKFRSSLLFFILREPTRPV